MDAPIPEIYSPASGWRTLTGANHSEATAFPDGNWYYPKAFNQPWWPNTWSQNGILVLGNWTRMWFITTEGAGTITELASLLYPGDYKLPSLTYAEGKILTLRADKKVQLVNMLTNPPQVSYTRDIDQVRFWANATVMADGKVLVNGGSTVENDLTGVAYKTQIWNPATGTWTTGAAAQKAQLYHSIAILLPDGTVLTGAEERQGRSAT